MLYHCIQLMILNKIQLSQEIHLTNKLLKGKKKLIGKDFSYN